MRNNLTKIFALMAMSVTTLTVFADTAIMHSKIGENGADIEAANSWTGLSGSTAEGFIVDMPDNTSKNFNQAGWVSYNETNYKAIKNSNGQRIRIQLPSGKEAQSVSLYVYTNYEAEAAMRFNGVDVEDVVPAESTNENPAIITKALENETSFDFTFYNSDPSKNAQVCFIAVITYRNQPTIDPTRLFTFGYKATVVDEGETHTISALTLHEDNCDDVTTGNLNEAYNTASDKKVYHGTSTQFVDARSYRSMKGGTHISSQEVAETEGAYIGYNLTIAENHFLTITKISTDIFNIKNDLYYEFVIQNSSEVTLYKSAVQTISRPQSGNHRIELTNKSDAWRAALSGLQGEIQVKLIFWSSNISEYIAPSEFYVTGLVHEKTSQTKTLKAIEVNGVDYDYENDGNTISTLLHAVPEVKFYYDVKNNWSDGSQTAADDENETIVASVSGDDYVAATTMLETPYSLTFTNIDLPKVFGIKRTVADETSTSSDEIVTAKRVSDDILVDPSVTGVTISKSYGLQSVMQDKSRAIKWFDGTAQQDCYIDKFDKNYRTQFEKGVVPESAEAAVSITSLDERCYYSFDLAVDLGYKFSLQALNSDVLKEMYGTHYQVKIYNNGELLKTLEDVGSATTEADMKRHFDLSEEAVLQELSGTVTVKMFVWNTEATKYVNIKDFTVEAVVEKKAGEGVEGLVFTDFTPAPQPVFTEGEVTAVWSRNIGGNISPDVKNEVKRGIRMQTGYDYTMRLSVPSDSYISEVVFVWNKNGNKTTEVNPDYFLDLSIRNSSNVEVSTLQYGGAKVDETIWSCGDVRESELKFVQGAGDFYCHSIRVTYLKKPATTTYVRTHTHMNLNTLCYPYQIDSYTGATFYTMLYKVVENTEVTEVVLQEHVGALEAGKPYFYVPEGSELVCEYSGAYTDAGNDGNGVYGSYTDMAAVTSGMYVTYNNQIIKAGDNVKLREYRAYIKMDEVALQAVPAPGRRILRVGNADAPAVTTGAERIRTSEINGQKIICNGQLFIIRDGKTYDIFGRLVD